MSSKKNKHPDTLPYNREIAKRIRELTRAGVPVVTIFADIQSFSSAPGSLKTYYKLYRQDMESARASTTEQIASKLIKKALEDDTSDPAVHKSREFYLDRVGGWNKKTVEETREVGSEEQENEGAVNALMAALGKSVDGD